MPANLATEPPTLQYGKNGWVIKNSETYHSVHRKLQKMRWDFPLLHLRTIQLYVHPPYLN